MSLCQDPCEFTSACAEGARCQAKMHRPICTCPMGYEGNPAIKCTKSPTSKINLHISIGRDEFFKLHHSYASE